MREPLSTWTNFAYAAAGAFVLEGAQAPVDAFLGVSLILLSVGSWLFHYSPKSVTHVPTVGQRSDEAAMYIALSAVISLLAFNIYPSAWVLPAGIALAFGLATAHDWLDSFIMIPTLSVLATALIVPIAGLGWALGIAGLFAVATGIRALGSHYTSDALHAVWHILTAGGFVVLYDLVVSHTYIGVVTP